MKRIIKYLFLLILGIIIALALVPFLFKDQIIEEIEAYANESLNATLNFEDVSLSLIKSFPNASITIHGISIVGQEDFEDVVLFSADALQLETDIKAAVSSSGDLTIKEFHLDNGEINIINNKAGKTNYDIFKDTGSDNSNVNSSDLQLAIQSYSVNSTDITYRDYQSDISFEAEDFNQQGKGDFTLNDFVLSTTNNIGKTSLNLSGINYLKNTPISGPLDLGVNIPASIYTLKDNSIQIHDLLLKMVGVVDINENDIKLDLNIDSDQGDIRNFLSLIPNAYYSQLPTLETKGEASISAKIKGSYSDNRYPAIDFKINTKDGYLASSDLPEPIKDLNMNFTAKASEGSWNDLIIDIPQFSLSTLGKPFRGKVNLKNVMADPIIDMMMEGELDMNTIGKLIGGDEINFESGSLATDFILKGKQSDFENEAYANIQFDGDASLKDFKADYYEYKDIVIDDVQLQFEPSALSMKQLSGKLGQSDFSGDIELENPLAYFITDKSMKGNVNLKSDLIDLTPYLSEATDTDLVSNPTATGETFDESIIRESLVTYNVDIKEVRHPDYKIENVKSVGKLSAENVNLSKSSIVLNDQAISFDGNLENVWDYMINDEILSGTINITGGKLDLNAFMSGEESSNTSESAEAFLLPKNIRTTLTGKFDQIKYSDYEFDNLKGKLVVENGIALFDGIAGNVLDGKIKLDGLYDSSDSKVNPKFNMKYDLSQFKWSKTFAAVETFRKLAPVGKFIDGLFNSTLTFAGELGKDMYPSWNNLSASGFIHTLDGSVKGMAPIEKIGDALGIEAIKNFKITDTKNWFEVKDGFVEIKPFDFDIEDMKFKAGGKHSLDQDLDYVIEAVIPRERLKSGQVGQAASQGLDYLLKEAKNRGVDVDLGDFVYLDIFLTGKLANPKVKVVPKGSGGKTAKDIVTDKVVDIKETVEDTIKKEVNKQVETAKDSMIARAKEEGDRLKEKVEEEKDKAIEKGKEIVKDKVGDIINEEAGGVLADTLASKVNDKLGDILENEKAKEEIDKVKDKIKNWDPFKKKGGGGGN